MTSLHCQGLLQEPRTERVSGSQTVGHTWHYDSVFVLVVRQPFWTALSPWLLWKNLFLSLFLLLLLCLFVFFCGAGMESGASHMQGQRSATGPRPQHQELLNFLMPCGGRMECPVPGLKQLACGGVCNLSTPLLEGFLPA